MWTLSKISLASVQLARALLLLGLNYQVCISVYPLSGLRGDTYDPRSQKVLTKVCCRTLKAARLLSLAEPSTY